MFKKSRRKIVAAIMSILVLLWAGTLGIIYASSFFEMTKQNKQMLKAHAEMYTLAQTPNEMRPPNRPFPGGNSGFAQTPMFQLSTFYTVAFSYEGDILEIKNESPIYTDNDLQLLAQKIIKSGRNNGTENNLVFYKTEKDGYILVTFKDNTVINESAMTLF